MMTKTADVKMQRLINIVLILNGLVMLSSTDEQFSNTPENKYLNINVVTLTT